MSKLKHSAKPSPKYNLESKIKTKQAHLQSLTIQEIIDRDKDGSNILSLLHYRRSRGSNGMTDTGVPFGYFEFNDEVNVSLDIYIYANSDLIKQFPTRFTKGELKLKIKEIENSQKMQKIKAEREERERAAQRARELRLNEQSMLDSFIRDARIKEARERATDGMWGAW